MVLVILLLVTTPILVFLKFLSAILLSFELLAASCELLAIKLYFSLLHEAHGS